MAAKVSSKRRPEDEKQKHTNGEEQIANARDYEGLRRRAGRLRLVEPKPDEQIRTQAYQFPGHIKHQEVAGEHQ